MRLDVDDEVADDLDVEDVADSSAVQVSDLAVESL